MAVKYATVVLKPSFLVKEVQCWLCQQAGVANLPNPVQDDDNTYVPRNMPAIGDLFDLFRFGHEGGGG
jgi:hypothetical protein